MPVTAPTQRFRNPVATTYAFGRIFSGIDSTVYFSQVLKTAKEAGRCYQVNDPVSEEISDVLDTDGGSLILDDAVEIVAIKPFRSGILVFAKNGVWYIFNPDGGFKATAFNTTKVSERGLASRRSLVEAEGRMFFFSGSGIISIAADEFDNLRGEDITETSIRDYYIENFVDKNSQGEYNEREKRIEWWNPEVNGKGLVLDLTINAYYPQQNAGSPVIGKPLKILNDFVYTYWDSSSTYTGYGLATASNEEFKDFGVDQDAYLITGWETLGKFSHKKSINQAKVYFNKTETTITGYSGGFNYDKPSGCLFQARWDFDYSDKYNKWVGEVQGTGRGQAVQLYQPLQRGFIPDAYPYTFDTGESILSKKINVRGCGDAVQFLFKAEAEKDMQLLGYSVTYTMKGRM